MPSHTTLRFLHQKLPVRETIASERRSGERNSDICVWLRAGGEEFHDVLWRKGWNIELGDDQALATRLADHLEDWVCEPASAGGSSASGIRGSHHAGEGSITRGHSAGPSTIG